MMDAIIIVSPYRGACRRDGDGCKCKAKTVTGTSNKGSEQLTWGEVHKVHNASNPQIMQGDKLLFKDH